MIESTNSNLHYIYFTIDNVIQIHSFIIKHSGGMHGILDIGKIESVLEHMQNNIYYPELDDKLTHLVFSVNKLHAFSDGNKRTSIALGALFLQVNGLDYCIDKFIVEMENIAVFLADSKIDKPLLHEIIYSILTEDTFNESLQLKIIDALL